MFRWYNTKRFGYLQLKACISLLYILYREIWKLGWQLLNFGLMFKNKQSSPCSKETKLLWRFFPDSLSYIAHLYICITEALMVPHISSTEHTMSFVLGKQVFVFLHDTCRGFVRCVAKTHARNKTTLHFCKIV